MIRHKATGTELAWRPTRDYWGDNGTGWALSASDDRHSVVFSYPAEQKSTIYANGVWEDEHGRLCYLYADNRDDVLAKAVELGVIEVIPDEPPASEEKDYDAIHRAGEAEQRSIYVEALTVAVAHEWSTAELRSAAICELRRLALEDR